MIGAVTAGMAHHEGDGQLDQRQARLVGQLGELLGGVQLAPVLGQGQVEAVGQALPGDGHRSGPAAGPGLAAGPGGSLR